MLERTRFLFPRLSSVKVFLNVVIHTKALTLGDGRRCANKKRRAWIDSRLLYVLKYMYMFITFFFFFFYEYKDLSFWSTGFVSNLVGNSPFFSEFVVWLSTIGNLAFGANPLVSQWRHIGSLFTDTTRERSLGLLDRNFSKCLGCVCIGANWRICDKYYKKYHQIKVKGMFVSNIFYIGIEYIL